LEASAILGFGVREVASEAELLHILILKTFAHGALGYLTLPKQSVAAGRLAWLRVDFCCASGVAVPGELATGRVRVAAEITPVMFMTENVSRCTRILAWQRKYTHSLGWPKGLDSMD